MTARPFGPVVGVGLSLLLALNSVGCGGGGSSHKGGSPTTGGELKTVSVPGRVVLPGGGALPSGSTVGTAFGSFPVASDGTFAATVADGLPSLVTVGHGGTTLMMGMFGKDRTALDARAEALGIVLLRTGLGALPFDALRPIVLEGGASPAVASLAQALEGRGAANPSFGDLARASAPEIAAASAAFVGGGSRGVVVDPSGPQSGVTVVQTSLNRIAVQNEYRRRAIAWIDRVSYLPEGEGTLETESKASLKELTVAPTTGLTSVVGGYVDAISGNVAYGPTTTEETSLPVAPSDARSTRYLVSVAGPGTQVGKLADLSDDRRRALDELTINSFLIDLAIPAFTNLVLGGLATKYSDKDSFARAATILRSVVSAFPTVPGLTTQILDGDYSGAFATFVNFATTDSGFQTLFLDGVTQSIKDRQGAVASDAFKASMGNIVKALGIADFVFAAADLRAVTKQYYASSKVDEFTVNATKSRVKLRPAAAETNAYTEVALEATAPDASGGEQGIAYDWSVTGTGALRDGTQNATTIRERDGKLSFAPSPGQFGTATVTVKATKTNADGSTESLGEATAKIEVKDVQVVLTPRRQSLKPGATATFSASVTNDAAGGPYLYSFYGSNGFGYVEDEHRLQSSLNATYHAKSAEGKDTVTVEVYRNVAGTPIKIAEATGEARVEQEPTIIQGSLQFLRESYADGTTPYRCITAYVGFSPPPGATRLVLHGYGGNDTAYYGKSIERTLYPPFSTTSFIGTTIPNATGLSGGGGAGTEDPDDTYYRNRFGAFVWEIEAYK